jgi:hypothetical protein
LTLILAHIRLIEKFEGFPMSYSNILTPRSEVLKGEGIQGVIDLENLRNQKRKHLNHHQKNF